MTSPAAVKAKMLRSNAVTAQRSVTNNVAIPKSLSLTTSTPDVKSGNVHGLIIFRSISAKKDRAPRKRSMNSSASSPA